MTALSALETTQFATFTWQEIESGKFDSSDPDDYSEALDSVIAEARARYSREDNGDLTTYLAEVTEVFTIEWNDPENWPQ